MHRKIQASLLVASSAVLLGSLIAITETIVSKSIDSLLPPVGKVNIFSRPGTIEFYSSRKVQKEMD